MNASFLQSRSFPMKVLEVIAGVALGAVTLLILAVGSLFAVGSMGQYVRNKSM